MTDAAAPDVPADAGEVRPVGQGAVQRWGPVVSGTLPLIAVILFFTVPIDNAWVFFLLIPLGGALFAGSRGHEDR